MLDNFKNCTKHVSGFTKLKASIWMGAGCASGWIPTSWAYFNAMGLAQNNTGFVTRISFMLAACLSAAIIFLYIFFWTKRSSKQISSKQFTSCSTVMMFGIALGYYCNTTHTSSEPIAVLLGICYACGNALIDLSWLSKISETKTCSPIPTLVIASCTSSVAILVINQFEYSLTIAVLMIAFTCASAFLYSKSNNHSNMATSYSSIKNVRERQGIVSALLCMLVCELIVAIANVAIHDTFFSSIMSNVNMDVAAVIAVLLTVLMYAIGNRRVDLAKAYKFWMIIMLLIFSLMPFFSQQMSSSGYVMAVCWNFLGIACSYYLTQTIRVNRLNPTLYFSMSIFFAEIILAFGICLGLILNIVSTTYNYSLLTMLLVVAIYPLGMVLLYLQRTPGAKAFTVTSQTVSASTNTKTKNADHVAADGAAFLGILNKRMKQFATKYCLTLREEEICLHIAKGHAIKTIASELCISDNTVWSHIKNIYIKCNVSTKPELMELIEEWLNLESRTENK